MSHVQTTRNPMSEARRQHVHGDLEPLDPPIEKGRYLLAVLIFIAVTATLFVAAVS